MNYPRRPAVMCPCGAGTQPGCSLNYRGGEAGWHMPIPLLPPGPASTCNFRMAPPPAAALPAALPTYPPAPPPARLLLAAAGRSDTSPTEAP